MPQAAYETSPDFSRTMTCASWPSRLIWLAADSPPAIPPIITVFICSLPNTFSSSSIPSVFVAMHLSPPPERKYQNDNEDNRKVQVCHEEKYLLVQWSFSST